MNKDSSSTFDLDHFNLSQPRYIAIEGPIGVGKTTLTKMIARTLGYETLLERAEDNPFLPRFYRGEANAALSTQLFFLLQRSQQVNALRQNDLFSSSRIADFLIDKDPLFAQVTLDKEELRLYKEVFQHVTINAPRPDLVVYLQAPTEVLIERISKRGIKAERSIDPGYLQELNEVYADYFHYYEDSPLLIVNASEIDWTNNLKDFENLIKNVLTTKRGRHYYNPQTIL